MINLYQNHLLDYIDLVQNYEVFMSNIIGERGRLVGISEKEWDKVDAIFLSY